MPIGVRPFEAGHALIPRTPVALERKSYFLADFPGADLLGLRAAAFAEEAWTVSDSRRRLGRSLRVVVSPSFRLGGCTISYLSGEAIGRVVMMFMADLVKFVKTKSAANV